MYFYIFFFKSPHFRSSQSKTSEVAAGKAGSSKGPCSRMLVAKKGKQVEPLHYIVPVCTPIGHLQLTLSMFSFLSLTHTLVRSHLHKILGCGFQNRISDVLAAGQEEHKPRLSIFNNILNYLLCLNLCE